MFIAWEKTNCAWNTWKWRIIKLRTKLYFEISRKISSSLNLLTESIVLVKQLEKSFIRSFIWVKHIVITIFLSICNNLTQLYFYISLQISSYHTMACSWDHDRNETQLRFFVWSSSWIMIVRSQNFFFVARYFDQVFSFLLKARQLSWQGWESYFFLE